MLQGLKDCVSYRPHAGRANDPNWAVHAIAHTRRNTRNTLPNKRASPVFTTSVPPGRPSRRLLYLILRPRLLREQR
jgi:hypothetical protein